MTSTYTRRVERFQNRFQQRVNLADDELARLNTYYNSLRAEVVDAQDKLNRIKIQTEQVYEVVSGNVAKANAEHKARIALIKANHSKKVAESQKLHDDEMIKYHSDYEKTLKEVEEWSKTMVDNHTKDIDDQIEHVMNLMDKIRNAIPQSDEETGDQINDAKRLLEFDLNQTSRLEEDLKRKTEERLEILSQLKEKLFESVSTLEELDSHHANVMRNISGKISTIDERYQEKIKQETEKQNHIKNELETKLNDLNFKIAAVQRLINATEDNAKSKLEQVSQEADSLKSDVMIFSTSQPPNNSMEQTELMNSTREYDDVEKLLSVKENELIQTRTQNESLKREIARLKHEELIRQKRALRKA